MLRDSLAGLIEPMFDSAGALLSSLSRCWQRESKESSDEPSRPGELHPEPLTDPDLHLSIHPARATPIKAAAFRRDQRVPPVAR